jgi:hypothetical protein
MKRVLLVALVIACLVLAGGVLAKPEDSGLPPACVVERGSISGGGYRLTSLAWQISGSLNGGDYQLSVQTEPLLRGSGCCCAYLPIAVRSSP